MYAQTERSSLTSTWSGRPARFAGLGSQVVHGFEAIVADHGPARLLELRGLSRRRCPEGLLLPNRNRTHTYGMRFDVDLLFIDDEWNPLIAVPDVTPRKMVKEPDASHLLILPSDWDIQKLNATVEGQGR